MAAVMNSRSVIEIRPFRADDATATYEAVRESLDELIQWMPWCRRDYSLEDARRWIEEQVKAFDAKTAYQFAIVADGRYAGAIGLNDVDNGNRRANLGYWIRSSAIGRGVATAAVTQLHRWTMDNTELFRLELLIAVGNLASQRVAEKAGATREGILRQRINVRGVAHDAVLYSLTRTGPSEPSGPVEPSEPRRRRP